MNITGLEALWFGVDDIEACTQYLTDYGLKAAGAGDPGGAHRFESLDGSAILLSRAGDPSLPPFAGSTGTLRKTVYGVADSATLEAIEAELSRDREVRRCADGSIEAPDDMGFVIGFQVSRRRPLEMPVEKINGPGAAPRRAANEVGLDTHAPALPRTLSHVVCFVPDVPRAQAFYVERLGFRVTDMFTDAGPFLRPAGSPDHHCLFFIQTPPHMLGCDHFAFHLGGPTEVMQAGSRFIEKGYQSFWGPGRHLFGSNWFWYFNSPLGCRAEYDADMDQHDDRWVPRNAGIGTDTSQAFLFQYREKWAPGPGKPAH